MGRSCSRLPLCLCTWLCCTCCCCCCTHCRCPCRGCTCCPHHCCPCCCCCPHCCCPCCCCCPHCCCPCCCCCPCHRQGCSTQFHSQDEEKNYAFGYSNINSARQESGNALTGVTGSYSDGFRTYNYVADGLGFRHI